MASLLARLRIVTLGNLHQLVDAIVDLNSPAAVRQYIRDLEGGIVQVEDAANTAEGGLRTTRQDLRDVRLVAARLDADITALLTNDDSTDDSLALPLQVKLNAANKRIESLSNTEAQQNEMLNKLNDAIGRLKAKHADMMSQLETIEAQVEATKAMNTVSQAVAGVADLAVDAPSVDNLASRINQQNNVASAGFDRAMSKLGDATSNDVNVAQAAAEIARRKVELAAKKQADPAGA